MEDHGNILFRKEKCAIQFWVNYYAQLFGTCPNFDLLATIGSLTHIRILGRQKAEPQYNVARERYSYRIGCADRFVVLGNPVY